LLFRPRLLALGFQFGKSNFLVQVVITFRSPETLVTADARAVGIEKQGS